MTTTDVVLSAALALSIVVNVTWIARALFLGSLLRSLTTGKRWTFGGVDMEGIPQARDLKRRVVSGVMGGLFRFATQPVR